MFHVLDLKHYIAGRLLSPAWLGCQRCSWYLPPGWLSVAILIAQSFIISCHAFIFVFLKGVRVNDHNDHNDQHTFDCEKETTCTVVRMQRLHAGVYLLLRYNPADHDGRHTCWAVLTPIEGTVYWNGTVRVRAYAAWRSWRACAAFARQSAELLMARDNLTSFSLFARRTCRAFFARVLVAAQPLKSVRSCTARKQSLTTPAMFTHSFTHCWWRP